MTITVRLSLSPYPLMYSTNTVNPDISIDGDTAVAFTEDVEKRFQAYGWHTLHVDNGDS